MTIRAMTVVALACSFACSKGKEEAARVQGTPQAAANEKAVAHKPPAAAPADNPCELLTEAIVRKHLKVAPEVTVEHRLSSPGGHAHCSYNWNTLTPEEEKLRNEEMRKAMIERAKTRSADKGNAAKDIASLAQQSHFGHGSAHLTMTKEMDSEGAAVGALDSSREYMKDRAKGKVGDTEVDFTSSAVDVSGIGSKAYYSAKQRQLSVAYGKRVYHLGATPDRDGDSFEIAKALARELFP